MQTRQDWMVLALLVAIRAMFGMQAQSVGALGPLLVGPLLADFVALGTLVGAYQSPGVLVSLPAGALVARLGDRRILTTGMVLMALGGAVLAMAPGLPMALVGRVASGAGGALLNLVLIKLVLDRFSGPALPVALGCMLGSWPGGIALALLGLPPIAALLDWRAALGCVALVFALLLLAVPALGAGGPPPRGAAVASARPPNWPALVAAGLAWVGYNTALILVLTFAPALFVAQGADAAAAGRLSSLYGWVLVPMLPLGGWLAGRWGRPVPLALLGLAGMVLLNPVLAVAGPGAAGAATLLGIGVLCGLAGAPIFSLPAQVLPPAARGLGMGVYYTIYYAGMALAPPVAGWARDASGEPGAPMLAAACCAAISAVAVLAFARFARPERT